ncbi:N-acetylglucosamine-6-phosphate deacetylase [Phenylobacterium sp.]|uniref:N-acetylglucosamine-6-phosphate deacetylase n=1 Tax=Phenylobacterium sp. TaxID=1871053 RepID=UPI002810C077|nr:N-acetylglucosamine-6-phosphate deacetylase [Phenylobacterium sp.]
MAVALTGGRVLNGHGFVTGQGVVLEGDRIAAVLPETETLARADQRVDLQGAILAPGFVDVQVNGGGGVLFNDDLSVDAIAAIGAAHRKFGTTGFLPTLISEDLGAIDRALRAVEAAIAAGVPGVLGVHVEGPFLNAARAGIHDKKKFRVLDERASALLGSLSAGVTLVTLAPERTEPQMIRRLAAAGVVIAAGHTDADYDQIRAALEAGVSGFTHLFNAMSPMTARAPGAVGAALEAADGFCGVIVDGRHVHPAMLRLALRCKPAERFMLVTDAMPSVGLVDKSFTLQGQTITVQDGVCVAPDGTLAGSDLDMASAVRNTRDLLGLDLPTALRMASLHPAQFLGLDHEIGRIAAGQRADLVLLDDDARVQATWIGGNPLWT